MAESWIFDGLTGLVAFAIFLLPHVAIWRTVGAERAGFVLMSMLWLAALFATLAGVWTLGGPPVRPLTVIAVDGALMAFYMHLYTGMLRSVSLRLLGEMLAAGGRLDIAAIERVYSPEQMLESRLDWLVEQGWIDLQESRYVLTPAGRRILAVRRPLADWLVEGQTG